MIRFFLLAAGLHLCSTVMLGAGIFAFGPPLFILPVAWYCATDRTRLGLALMAVAGLSPVAAGWQAALVSVLIAGFGLPLGVMLRQRWPFGRIVVAMTALVFTPIAVFTALNWETVHETYGIWITARIAEFDAAAEQQSNTDIEQVEAVRDYMVWTNENWAYLNLGWSFGSALLAVTAGVALINRRLLLRNGTAQAQGHFRDMRPSEWLVWLAIALAACWFIDNQWPNEALRIVAWNGAIALAFVYWLNGFAIMLYGLQVMSGGAALAYMLMIVLVLLWMQILPASIGLFDTWFDLRRRIDRLAELRRMREQSGDGMD